MAGCTCNGKDQAGLASVPIENDPTLRKGDIVAGANGLMVANPEGGKRAEANFTPLPENVRRASSTCPWWRGSSGKIAPDATGSIPGWRASGSWRGTAARQRVMSNVKHKGACNVVWVRLSHSLSSSSSSI